MIRVKSLIWMRILDFGCGLTLAGFLDIFSLTKMGPKFLLSLFVMGLVVYPVSLYGGKLSGSLTYAELKLAKKDPAKILREIYEEVKELGKFPGDDFIKREFFVGKDDDDTYQDIHVVVLIQNIGDEEKMTIQVTYMQPSESDPTVKFAKSVRSILCSVNGDIIDILKSDYNEREHRKILPQILRAIRGKKKLLKKILHQLNGYQDNNHARKITGEGKFVFTSTDFLEVMDVFNTMK